MNQNSNINELIDSIKADEKGSHDQFIQGVKEIRSIIMGISSKQTAEIIRNIPDDLLITISTVLRDDLEEEMKGISNMPMSGGFPTLGDLQKITIIKNLLNSIDKKLKGKLD